MDDSFWHVTIANVVTWALVVLGNFGTAAFFLLKLNKRVDDAEAKLEDNEKNHDSLDKYVRAIDSMGTQASRMAISKETEILKSTLDRLSSHDNALQDLIPQVATMKESVEWIKHYIQRNGKDTIK